MNKNLKKMNSFLIYINLELNQHPNLNCSKTEVSKSTFTSFHQAAIIKTYFKN